MEPYKRIVKLSELCDGAGIACKEEYADIEISGITADSRRVGEGNLFIALNGIHRDGRKYIRDAKERGAVACVCEGSEECDIPSVRVLDARGASARLFAAYYGHPERRIRFVGVTGTNGKTTVSSMIFHALNSAMRKAGLIGTLGAYSPLGKVDISPSDANANMTTPDPEELYPLLDRMCRDGAEYVVMEVSSHALALKKLEPLTFDVAVFTNLTPEHLDMHGDMESYFGAKRILFSQSKTAIINADDKYGERLLKYDLSAEEKIACRVGGAHSMFERVRACEPGVKCAYAEQISFATKGDGVEYRLISPDSRVRIFCPVPGGFNVMNSMQAALASLSLGLSSAEVRAALATFDGVKGRLERVEIREDVGFSVYIDYAHTPDALENLLATAHSMKKRGGRITLVFGCGGDRDPSKRREMAHIASRMADFTVITSDNSRSEDPQSIISDILKGIDKESAYAVIPDRADAIRYAVKHARRGDIILLAGKGHEEYEIDKNGRHPFCEKEIVLQSAREYWGRV